MLPINERSPNRPRSGLVSDFTSQHTSNLHYLINSDINFESKFESGVGGQGDGPINIIVLFSLAAKIVQMRSSPDQECDYVLVLS